MIIKKKQKEDKKFKKFTQTIIEELDPPSLVVKREESSAKAEFIIEDLPYHLKRVYAHGENSYSRPWSIKPET